MAIRGDEAEVPLQGIDTNRPSKGSFAVNMLFRDGAVDVRLGFGQVTQLDTSFGRNVAGATAEWGFTKLLGSYLMTTNFGHDQVISCWLATVNTGNYSDRSLLADIYIVSIYDLTTGDRWEEPIYRHTSENSTEIVPLESQHPNYETAIDRDNQAWIQGDGGAESYFYFTEYRDVLYFGNQTTGLLAYFPATFSTPTVSVHRDTTNNTQAAVPTPRLLRRASVDAVNEYEWSPHGYGESCLVLRAVPADGDFSEAFAYFGTSDFPNPVAVTSLGSRLVLASGKEVYFSDPGKPTAIIADNYIEIPSEGDVTAIREHNGNLLIWTNHETYLYQPSVGNVVSGGRLTQMSDHVGCVGANAVVKVEGAVYWLDTNGVYATPGDLSIGEQSEGISPLFETSLTDPRTSFYIETGFTPFDNAQPRTAYQADFEGAHLAYSADLGALFVTFPNLNASLTLSSGQWSLWLYETAVYAESSTPKVGLTKNINNPWIIAKNNEVLLVGGPDIQALVDTAQEQGTTDVNDDTTSRSGYILRYGRGGALDRSVQDEDGRTFTGKYKRNELANRTGNDRVFYIDPWIPLPQEFIFPSGSVVPAGREAFLLPIYAVIPSSLGATAIDAYQLTFRFDNTQWAPKLIGASTEIDIILPTKRVASVGGYKLGSPVAGTSEAQVYSAGVPTVGGNEIRLAWDGTGGTWLHAPQMNLMASRREPILYIPMLRVASKTEEISGMGIAPITAELYNGASNPSASVCWWEQWVSRSQRKANSVTQPVSWALLTPELGKGDGTLYKARGMYVTLLSHGAGTAGDYLVTSWPFGQFNSVLGVDTKTWQSQLVDHTESPDPNSDARVSLAKLATIRTRVYQNGVMREKTFGNTNLVYGNPADSSVGNVLIDDALTSEIATSDSAKGESFAYLLHGDMQDKSNRIRLEKIISVLRVVGGRRRRGRSSSSASSSEV